MIKDLTYSVTFPTNGVSLRGHLTPPPGFTAVVGENGSGKSFGSIEMVRYMLFGKRALRGPAADYKTLDASMDFEIAGRSFRVTRNRKAEQLLDAEGNVLAVGAEALDKRITKELGFGLEVFDVCCASVQKESDRLSRLKPAERKRLIDEVVGLTSNETAEKACRDEARGLRREAEALRQALVPVDVPVEPEGYRPANTLAQELADARERINKRYALERTIAAVGPLPVAPVREVTGLEEIEAAEEQRAQDEAERRQLLSRIAQIPDATHSVEILDLAQSWEDYRAECQRRGPRPTITVEQADAGLEAWANFTAAKGLTHLDVECPKCQHHFVTNGEVPAEPEMSLAFYRAEQKANESWLVSLQEPAPLGIALTKTDIRGGYDALARAEEKTALTVQLKALPMWVDRSSDLRALRQLSAEWAVYAVAVVAFDARASAAAEAQAELKQLGPIEADTTPLEAQLMAAKVYEVQLAKYATDKERHDEIVANITDRSKRADDFKAGADALAGARATLKAFLAPSLSRVGSTLIDQMTGGALTSIVVDEDMNISVGGQDIATLSGAGSTVANLALRIALGQILVRGVFPVFIADEADSDMSAKRAQYTMECLGSLRDQLQQVIVITHKRLGVDVEIPVDHVVDMDNLPGD